jgi:hypothetical protein
MQAQQLLLAVRILAMAILDTSRLLPDFMPVTCIKPQVFKHSI